MWVEARADPVDGHDDLRRFGWRRWWRRDRVGALRCRRRADGAARDQCHQCGDRDNDAYGPRHAVQGIGSVGAASDSGLSPTPRAQLLSRALARALARARNAATSSTLRTRTISGV